jgi:hypothetical protein
MVRVGQFGAQVESFAMAAVPMVPLDAAEAVAAVFESGLGTIIQFALLMFVTILVIGSLFAFGAAGLARMSQDAGRQGSVGTYLASAGIMLLVAVVLGAGPEILSALGFEVLDHISPVNIFSP